ncbi:putative DCC family thiol-disulfide oxidoreductase YuxK [Thioalkalivibrio sp. ALE21]|uniref:thiol-disulfide oxidoreductase DCC family protein n=1 Tax=Thioalkalivibrio sp. ALE21 TaxID=1158175 RepID=UPI000D9D1FB2|nr:DUF393 domain-containing protein [Thioalkalivibrio sp. ALE21]PYG02756.1 putative DCC family thiol-disulfide oxidoreductase YuxK [Thioalkalivibrio sp. ALE21]
MPDTRERPVVFFDGGCPLCRREIGHYQRLDTAGRIDWRDIHADAAALEARGIAWEDAMRRMHAVDEHGRVVSGAYAFVATWRHLPYYRVAGAVLHRLPPVVWLMDRVYNVFARSRWRSRCRDGVCPPPPL